MNLFHVCSLKAWQPACAPVSIVLAADFHTAWTVYFWVPSPARLPADGNSCGLHQGQRDLSLYYQVQHKLCFHPTVPDPLRVSHYTPVTLHESERFNAFLPRFARFCGWMVYFINSNLCFEGTARFDLPGKLLLHQIIIVSYSTHTVLQVFGHWQYAFFLVGDCMRVLRGRAECEVMFFKSLIGTPTFIFQIFSCSTW